MRAKVGYKATRVRGTSAGFRVRSESEVVETKQFVRLRNADGQLSDWLPNEQFLFRAPEGRRVVNCWLISYLDAGEIRTVIRSSQDNANSAISSMRRGEYEILSTKKITIEV